MRKQTLLSVLAATMLVLAGCSGGTPADGGASPDDGTADGEASTDGTTSDDGTSTGTVEFYVSDKPSVIDDFRHLNVTIDRVGFERAQSESMTATATPTNTPNTTATATEANESDDNETKDNESEADDSEEMDSEDDDSESEDESGVITRDVDARSVDLTRLKGANATLIGTPEIPAGNYTKVTVYISDVNATLQDGSSVNVKLPSNTLKLTKGFQLQPNGTVQFVYDISVFKAGNSGKYILKPVISESGPDQDVKNIDDEAAAEEADDDSEASGTPTATVTPTSGGQEAGNQTNGADN